MAGNKIILHWLNMSRSNRILWLLEILGVDYEVKVYKRTPGFRAPKELEKVHPLGKSPVIEVVKPDGQKEVIAETACIIEYLLENYDHAHKLAPATDEGRKKVNYYLHYTEASLQPYLTGALVNLMAKKQVPFGINFLVGAVTGKINDMYYKSESIKNLHYLEDIAKENDGNYFVDNKLTGADIILSFPVAELVFAADDSRGLFDNHPKELFPYLYKWSQLILNDANFKKCDEIVAAQSKL